MQLGRNIGDNLVVKQDGKRFLITRTMTDEMDAEEFTRYVEGMRLASEAGSKDREKFLKEQKLYEALYDVSKKMREEELKVAQEQIQEHLKKQEEEKQKVEKEGVDVDKV